MPQLSLIHRIHGLQAFGLQWLGGFYLTHSDEIPKVLLVKRRNSETVTTHSTQYIWKWSFSSTKQVLNHHPEPNCLVSHFNFVPGIGAVDVGAGRDGRSCDQLDVRAGWSEKIRKGGIHPQLIAERNNWWIKQDPTFKIVQNHFPPLYTEIGSSKARCKSTACEAADSRRHTRSSASSSAVSLRFLGHVGTHGRAKGWTWVCWTYTPYKIK